MPSMKTVGIFGGSGFVGQHLVPTLERLGNRTRVFSRSSELTPALAVLPNCKLVKLGSFEPDALAKAISGCDAVINLIGILNERGRDGTGFHKVHVDLTQSILDSCASAGVPRYVHMSSLGAGQGKSHYLRSRGEAEARVRAAKHLHSTIFQPSVIFGFGDGLLSRFASLLRLFPVMPLACPQSRLAPVFVGDVTRAFTTVLSEQAGGVTYELCGPRTYTLREIVDFIRTTLQLRRMVIGLPNWASRAQAAVMDFVPGKPFSTDNYLSLQTDSVCQTGGLGQLGIDATPLELIAPLVLRAPRAEHRMALARQSHSFTDADRR